MSESECVHLEYDQFQELTRLLEKISDQLETIAESNASDKQFREDFDRHLAMIRNQNG